MDPTDSHAAFLADVAAQRRHGVDAGGGNPARLRDHVSAHGAGGDGDQSGVVHAAAGAGRDHGAADLSAGAGVLAGAIAGRSRHHINIKESVGTENGAGFRATAGAGDDTAVQNVKSGTLGQPSMAYRQCRSAIHYREAPVLLIM